MRTANREAPAEMLIDCPRARPGQEVEVVAHQAVVEQGEGVARPGARSDSTKTSRSESSVETSARLLPRFTAGRSVRRRWGWEVVSIDDTLAIDSTCGAKKMNRHQ